MIRKINRTFIVLGMPIKEGVKLAKIYNKRLNKFLCQYLEKK